MYTNWNQKASKIGPYKWIPLSSLVTYLHELRRTILFTPRRMTQSRLPKLGEVDVPCAENTRFPNSTTYLCESDDWKAEMDLLQLTVDVLINKKKLERKYGNFKTVGEAETFALEKINHILRLIYDGHDSVMDQEGFEDEYDLTWEVPPATEEAGNTTGQNLSPPAGEASNNTNQNPPPPAGVAGSSG